MAHEQNSLTKQSYGENSFKARFFFAHKPFASMFVDEAIELDGVSDYLHGSLILLTTTITQTKKEGVN